MGAVASQITSLTIVYSTVHSGTDQRKHQSSATLAFVRGIHRGPVNSPHKWPVTRKMFPFNGVIMVYVSYIAKNVMHELFCWVQSLEQFELCPHALMRLILHRVVNGVGRDKKRWRDFISVSCVLC